MVPNEAQANDYIVIVCKGVPRAAMAAARVELNELKTRQAAGEPTLLMSAEDTLDCVLRKIGIEWPAFTVEDDHLQVTYGTGRIIKKKIEFADPTFCDKLDQIIAHIKIYDNLQQLTL